MSSVEVVLLGASMTGKTDLFCHWVDGKRALKYFPTRHLERNLFNIYGSKKLALTIRDTGGQASEEKVKGWLKTCHASVIVFDVNSRKTFERAKAIYALTEVGDRKILIVGNQSASKGREIPPEEAQGWAAECGDSCMYIEASTHDGNHENAQRVLHTLAQLILGNAEYMEPRESDMTQPTTDHTTPNMRQITMPGESTDIPRLMDVVASLSNHCTALQTQLDNVQARLEKETSDRIKAQQELVAALAEFKGKESSTPPPVARDAERVNSPDPDNVKKTLF